MQNYSKNPHKKLAFSKQAGQFLMKTLNFDITPFKKLKNINVIPFYFENKSQTNFCEPVSNAAAFIVVFQAYVNYFILKFN